MLIEEKKMRTLSHSKSIREFWSIVRHFICRFSVVARGNLESFEA